jgi:hypothetical protein
MEVVNRELKDELKDYVFAEGADLFGGKSSVNHVIGLPAEQ